MDAKQAGHEVPEFALAEAAVSWLGGYTNGSERYGWQRNAKAYAHYVLARAGEGRKGQAKALLERTKAKRGYDLGRGCCSRRRSISAVTAPTKPSSKSRTSARSRPTDATAGPSTLTSAGAHDPRGDLFDLSARARRRGAGRAGRRRAQAQEPLVQHAS